MANERPVSALARTIAATFTEQLRARRISQQTAGEHIGVSQSHMGRYLHGEFAMDVDEIQGLCDLLGLDFNQFMLDAIARTNM